MKKIFLTFLLTILCVNSVFAQNAALPDSVQPYKYTFYQFGNETVDFIKQPLKWDGVDWLKLGLVGAGTVLIMGNVDQPIRTDVMKDQRYYYSAPVVAGRLWGEIYSPVVLFTGFGLYSVLNNDIGARKIAYEIGQASLYAGALSFVLKLAIGRSRPYMNQGNAVFRPFSSIFNQDNKSMPSGHSTVAFILSTVLSRNVKSPVLKVLAYLPAVMTMASRVYQDMHWTSDTFAGAALGYFVATWVVDQHENNNKSIVEVSSIYPLSISITF